MTSHIKELGPQTPVDPFPDQGRPLLFVVAVYTAAVGGSDVRVGLNEKEIPEGVTAAQVLTNALRAIISVGARVDPATFADTERQGEAVFEQ